MQLQWTNKRKEDHARQERRICLRHSPRDSSAGRLSMHNNLPFQCAAVRRQKERRYFVNLTSFLVEVVTQSDRDASFYLLHRMKASKISECKK